MKTLLLGAGNTHRKQIIPPGSSAELGDLTTVDLQAADLVDCGNHIIADLNDFPYAFGVHDEVHCYSVLEHLGTQGDFKFFFRQFNEIHRCLKPGGYFCFSVPIPSSIWAWGDPGHTRVLPRTVFSFLTEDHYDQLGKTACCDYREWIDAYWKITGVSEEGENLYVVLQT